ncbi:hypothetical protein N177_1953 [Lutibaculum baratangense AMV1]|uniref:Uncharacterized protein n=1 Tax=Lutibaculum baratangense AMV1 TaxID=631454 RepID=V4RIB5_9HYPH|nr:hypothetical protein N177_1953 [Lutibaculum baratangense AMV1]
MRRVYEHSCRHYLDSGIGGRRARTPPVARQREGAAGHRTGWMSTWWERRLQATTGGTGVPPRNATEPRAALQCAGCRATRSSRHSHWPARGRRPCLGGERRASAIS